MSHTVERTSRSGRFAELSGLFLRASSILLIVATLNIGNDVYTHPNDKVTCAGDSWVKRVEATDNKIVASSVHKPDGKYTYGPENLLDKRMDTCWCPQGDGIDEFIIVKIPIGAKGFKIINGLGKSRELFILNNRVKSLYVAFISKSKELENSGMCKHANKFAIIYQLNTKKYYRLQDTMESQIVLFDEFNNFGWDTDFHKFSGDVYLMIGIIDIYGGTKYNDTCISEIEIIK
jgi:hypothetical protein